jgi:hypothetical protein
MEKKTQNELILKHLKEYGGITSLEAIQEYGITRLSARIYDLRKEGYSISADKKKVLNRRRETCFVAFYSLA